jgi:hypothetical protein
MTDENVTNNKEIRMTTSEDTSDPGRVEGRASVTAEGEQSCAS